MTNARPLSSFLSFLLLVHHVRHVAALSILTWTTTGSARFLCSRSAHRTRHSSLLYMFSRSAENSSKKHFEDMMYQELSLPSVRFPYRVSSTSNSTSPTRDLIIRPMKRSDIRTVTNLCVEEYGEDPSQISSNVFSSEFWADWSEYWSLRQVVDLSMQLKVSPSYHRVPSDHAVLLACIEDNRNEEIAGMVELSRQPLLPQRNPPPFPIPALVKQAAYPGTPLQGWITNLLVAPSHRGKGFAKLLIAACEGIAKSWNCQSISLHCEADESRGNVAQQLYLRSGYQPVPLLKDHCSSMRMTSTRQLPWISDAATDSSFLRPSTVVIDGVALLYLRKDLV